MKNFRFSLDHDVRICLCTRRVGVIIRSSFVIEQDDSFAASFDSIEIGSIVRGTEQLMRPMCNGSSHVCRIRRRLWERSPVSRRIREFGLAITVARAAIVRASTEFVTRRRDEFEWRHAFHRVKASQDGITRSSLPGAK